LLQNKNEGIANAVFKLIGLINLLCVAYNVIFFAFHALTMADAQYTFSRNHGKIQITDKSKTSFKTVKGLLFVYTQKHLD